MTHKNLVNNPTTKTVEVSAAEHSKKTACLYVVATPIGNLEDLSARALRILQQVDLIAAEDTRHSRGLLEHFHIQNQIISLHEHNEKARSAQLISYLEQGQTLALISDAGTPLISDPGYSLVAQVRQAGFPVIPIPGACALIAALSVAGLPSDNFLFQGFLPAKQLARTQQLTNLSRHTATLIFYESPHRILASLEDMLKILGAERQACVAREISKHFETYLTGSLGELIHQIKTDPNQQKGEFVVLVAGYSGPTLDQAWQEAEHWLQELQQHLPPAKACALVAKMTGIKKQELYQRLLN